MVAHHKQSSTRLLSRIARFSQTPVESPATRGLVHVYQYVTTTLTVISEEVERGARRHDNKADTTSFTARERFILWQNNRLAFAHTVCPFLQGNGGGAAIIIARERKSLPLIKPRPHLAI